MQTSTATVSSAKDRHSGLRVRLARISRSACRTAGKHGFRLAAAGAALCAILAALGAAPANAATANPGPLLNPAYLSLNPQTWGAYGYGVNLDPGSTISRYYGPSSADNLCQLYIGTQAMTNYVAVGSIEIYCSSAQYVAVDLRLYNSENGPWVWRSSNYTGTWKYVPGTNMDGLGHNPRALRQRVLAGICADGYIWAWRKFVLRSDQHCKLVRVADGVVHPLLAAKGSSEQRSQGALKPALAGALCSWPGCRPPDRAAAQRLDLCCPAPGLRAGRRDRGAPLAPAAPSASGPSAGGRDTRLRRWGGSDVFERAPVGDETDKMCPFMDRVQRLVALRSRVVRPEPVMTLPRSAAGVLARHVLFEIEAIDRMYLSLDFAETGRDIASQHYAFVASEEEFDVSFGRIRQQELPYWAQYP